MEKLQEEPTEEADDPGGGHGPDAQGVVHDAEGGGGGFCEGVSDRAERSWQARLMLIALRADMRMRDFGGAPSAIPAADQQKLNEIINAPDAPAAIKGEATFMGIMIAGLDDINKEKPEDVRRLLQGGGGFLRKISRASAGGPVEEHPVAGARIEDLDAGGRGDALKKLAAGSGPAPGGSGEGHAGVPQAEDGGPGKTKPVDLKFTAADGQPIDLANLRGKVVLVDFWASWCGPCMMEMPNVVSTYGRLHDKGFEIVGISLDVDKAAMEGRLQGTGT